MENPTGRTVEGNGNEPNAALTCFYAAERRAGTSPLTALERTAEFAQRLSVLQQGRAS